MCSDTGFYDFGLLLGYQHDQIKQKRANHPFSIENSGGSRIFPRRGAPTPKIAIIFQIFAKNCMKMKEFGPPGGPHPLDPPMENAALEMVCEYWVCNSTSKIEKARVVQKAVEGTRKVCLANNVQYMLGTDACKAKKMSFKYEPSNSVNPLNVHDSGAKTKSNNQKLLSAHFLKCYVVLILASIFILVNALSL